MRTGNRPPRKFQVSRDVACSARRVSPVRRDPDLYSGHALRAGFASRAAQSGKTDRSIIRQTRHKSLAVLYEYVRERPCYHPITLPIYIFAGWTAATRVLPVRPLGYTISLGAINIHSASDAAASDT
jgi:hypothetical protein